MLDFIVVCVSMLEFTSLGNFTAIRSIRVLRPLRTITKVGGGVGGVVLKNSSLVVRPPG